MNFSNLFLFIAVLAATGAAAQDSKPAPKSVYTTTSGEIIFSFANINYKGNEEPSVIRFSPVFNFQNWVHFDKSENFGVFTGFSVRNIGFIYDVPDQPGVRMKHRTYNFGIPVGIKIGNLSDKLIFAGYELEIPFNYKEKTFINGDKTDVRSIWFSNRVNTFNHSLMAGVQLPYGATLKFKYYLTNFFNRDFEQSDGQGGITRPYVNSDYNVFYFSLSFALLKNTDFYYTDK
jgi:hypothetical protein